VTMEQPEAAPDLVGRTSARLLAAGLDRRDRLEALHLLAILDASIDTAGRVRRPLDDLAAEFELPPMSVMRSLDHLERAGAVQRDGTGVVLLGNSAQGLGGLQLADFLDDVRASFDGDADVPVRRRTTLLTRGAAVLVAAATAIVVLTFAPQPAVQQQTALSGADVGADTTVADRVDDVGPIGIPDALDAQIKPSTTVVAPITAPGFDTEVVAAASPTTTCAATSTTIPTDPRRVADAAEDDLPACLSAHGLVITGVTLAGPTVEERAPTRTQPAPLAEVLAPVDVHDVEQPTVVDDAPVEPSTEHAARTIRS
jgi:hypothetical protein